MDGSLISFLVIGAVVYAGLVFGGVLSLRRQDIAQMKTTDAMTATGNHVWSYLTPNQQEELAGMDSLIQQEEWIEEHVDPSVTKGQSAEKILVELANRGFIALGKGTFKRHASPLDFISSKGDIEKRPDVKNLSTDEWEDVILTEDMFEADYLTEPAENLTEHANPEEENSADINEN